MLLVMTVWSLLVYIWQSDRLFDFVYMKYRVEGLYQKAM